MQGLITSLMGFVAMRERPRVVFPNKHNKICGLYTNRTVVFFCATFNAI